MRYLHLLLTYTKIRRGEHPDWRGDRIYNADTFVYRTAHKAVGNWRQGDFIAEDIEANLAAYSDATGLPHSRLEFVAKQFRNPEHLCL